MKGKPILLAVGLAAVMVVSLVFLLGAAVTRLQAMVPDAWVEAAPLPVESGLGTSVQCPGDQDRFYVLGGLDAPSSGTAAFRRYDAATDSWQPLADYPAELGVIAAACADGHIYAAGGTLFAGVNITDAFHIYDIGANTWSPGPDLPRLVAGPGLGYWDGYLYLVGGANSSLTPVNQVDRYDIQAGIWEAAWGAPVPVLAGASWVQIGQYLYGIGGITPGAITNSNIAMRYDLANNQWDIGPEFTSRRAFVDVAATGQYLYAIGGDANGPGWWVMTDVVERLDWTAWPSGTWEIATGLPYSVEASVGACTQAVTGGEVWSAGGATGFQIYTDTNLYLAAEPCYTFYYDPILEPAAAAGSALPGEEVVYHFDLYNPAAVTDTYTVTLSAGWPAAAAATLGPVAPYHSAHLVVTVTVPLTADPGDVNVITITVTSQADPSLSTSATVTTAVIGWLKYLPIVYLPPD
jgi:hypothetical protein